jgi:DNA polymerase-1
MLVTRENFPECLNQCRSERLVVDVETTGLRPWAGRGRPADQVCGVAVLSEGKSFYYPIRHAGGLNIEPAQYEALIDLIGRVKIFVNHNTSFDIKMLTRDGMKFPERIVDTMVGAHLYNENTSHALKSFGDQYLGDDSSKEADDLDRILRNRGLSKPEMYRLDPALVAPYAEQDVVLADKLDVWLRENLYSVDLYDKGSEFARVLCQMEIWGMPLNLLHMASLRREAVIACHALSEQIRHEAGFPLNPNSPNQVCAWLKIRDSTKETLSRLKGRHEFHAKLILDYRSWNKACSTYYDRYLEWMDLDGVIHANLRATGTETGRLACRDPNLQAVSRWSESQRVREAFQPREGKVFVELDYSQAEIRVAAHYTQDEKQAEVFRRGIDFYMALATEMNVDRQTAKMINLAMQYGAGAAKLADKLQISQKKAMELVDGYHKTYPGTRKLVNMARNHAEQKGFVTMALGRRRHFNTREVNPKDAFQNVVQGSVAQVIQEAMIRIHKEIPHEDGRMLLQVHDSLLFEVAEKEVAEVINYAQAVMEHQPWCRVPIRVDAKVGSNWGQMEKYIGENAA